MSRLNEDLQDPMEEILQLHSLKSWTLLPALQDTTVLSDQSHTQKQLQHLHLYTYPPSTGTRVSNTDNSYLAFRPSRTSKYKEMLCEKLLMSPFRNANGQRGKTGHGKLQTLTIAQRIVKTDDRRG